MGKGTRPHPPSMAELVASELNRPRAIDPKLLTPGRINHEGNLCDLDGTILSLLESDSSESGALAAVRTGARLAFEGCGCGSGCSPKWFESEELNEAADPPHLVRGSAPAWIEIWASPGRQVVFVHGDYVWPELF